MGNRYKVCVDVVFLGMEWERALSKAKILLDQGCLLEMSIAEQLDVASRAMMGEI